MSYDPTIWKDNIVELPRTYTIQENEDGTITLVPAFGTIVQKGTPVNAANLNKLEQGLVAHLADYAAHGIPNLNANIIKTNFKIDSYFNATKNELSQMIIDVLSDETGINKELSTHHYNSTFKQIEGISSQEIATSGSATSALKIGNNNGEQWWVGQSFTATPGLNGKTALKASISLKNENHPAMEVHIYTDNGGAPGVSITPTGYGLVRRNSLKANYEYYDLVLNLSTPFISGTKYRLVIKPIEDLGINIYAEIQANANGGLLNGEAFRSNDNGSTWFTYPDWDAMLKISTIEPFVVIWNADDVDTLPQYVYVVAEHYGDIDAYISRDGGSSFTKCELENIVDISSKPLGTSVVLKIEGRAGAVLQAVGWGWK